MSGLIQLYTHFTPFNQGMHNSEIRHFEDINSYKELAEFFSNFFMMPHGCDTRWVSQENIKKKQNANILEWAFLLFKMPRLLWRKSCAWYPTLKIQGLGFCLGQEHYQSEGLRPPAIAKCGPKFG